jgi:hypothetical protein
LRCAAVDFDDGQHKVLPPQDAARCGVPAKSSEK